MLIEVCANSLQSALNAQEAGADRIELCSELGVGGVTPSYGLLKMVREQLEIPIHVLIRPRGGHFTYTHTEFEVMVEDIKTCIDLGMDGIVSGVLNADATLDLQRIEQLITASKNLHFTFHRAFDWMPNPLGSLKMLENLGAKTVLTSGQHPIAESGIHQLKAWQEQTSITIMAGGGLNPRNAVRFKEAGLHALHLSGTTFENAISLDKKVSMNSTKHLEEQHVAVTNVDVIRQMVRAVK